MPIFHRKIEHQEKEKEIKEEPTPKFRRSIQRDPNNHWDLINLSEKICFVCDKPIGINKAIYIGKKDGVELNRHPACDSNSDKWFKKFGKCASLKIK